MNEQSNRNLNEISLAASADKSILKSITTGEIDGIIIPDFLSKEEVERVVSGFSKTTEAERTQIQPGFDSYPMTFAQLEQNLHSGAITEERYFDASQSFVETFPTRYGVDVFGKLQSLIGNINNDIQLKLASPPNSSNHYTPYTFRELYPEKGMLIAHCENLFFKEFPGYFDRMSTFSVKEKQLSFFVVLQTPEDGGELTLYDLDWDDDQSRINNSEIDLGQGKTISLDSEELGRQKIKPAPGSLVLFSGGEIWHRVELVQSPPSRITLGGFMAFSHDGKTLLSWS